MRNSEEAKIDRLTGSPLPLFSGQRHIGHSVCGVGACETVGENPHTGVRFRTREFANEPRDHDASFVLRAPDRLGRHDSHRPGWQSGQRWGSESQGTFGAVAYNYRIGTYEVTNSQNAEFLGAKAASDSVVLYNTSIGSGFGGITRSGSGGSYSDATMAGRGDKPVNYVSW